MAGILGGTVVTVAVIGIAMGRFNGWGGDIPRSNKAVSVALGDSAPVVIEPRNYWQARAVLPARLCRMSGSVNSSSGEFEALLLNDDELRAWTRTRAAGQISSGRVASWNPSMMVMGPGPYHLIVADDGEGRRIVRINVTIACP